MAIISIPGSGLLVLGMLVLGLLLSIQALPQLPLLPGPQPSKEALCDVCLHDRSALPCRACKWQQHGGLFMCQGKCMRHFVQCLGMQQQAAGASRGRPAV